MPWVGKTVEVTKQDICNYVLRSTSLSKYQNLQNKLDNKEKRLNSANDIGKANTS